MLGYSPPSSDYSKARYMWVLGITLALILSIVAIRLVTATPARKTAQEIGVTLSTPLQSPPAAGTSTPESIISLDSSVVQPGRTKVSVNGQNIPVPASGSIRKTIENNNGNSQVNVAVNSETSGTNEAHSSTNVNLDSQTTLQVTTDNTE